MISLLESSTISTTLLFSFTAITSFDSKSLSFNSVSDRLANSLLFSSIISSLELEIKSFS